MILDPRTGNLRPSGPDIHDPRRAISHGIETPCRWDRRSSQQRLRSLSRSPIVVVADSLPHISLRMTRSAWTTPDQRVCWLSWGDLMQIVSVDGHVGDAGLEMRRRVVMLDSHQMWMPYVRARVVDAGGVIITVESERGSMGGRDGGIPSNVDVLRIVPLNIKEDEAFY